MSPRRLLVAALLGWPLLAALAAPAAQANPLFTVSVEHVDVLEGTGAGVIAEVPVRVDRANLLQAITVDWRTVQISAAHPTLYALEHEDFVPAQGTLVIPPGQTTATIPVEIVGDDVYENREAFRVEISNAQGAKVDADRRSAVVGILDDDPPPTVTVADVDVVEGDEGTTDAVVTLTSTGPTVLDSWIWYRTEDGTAVAGSDHLARSGMVAIPAGSSTAVIRVPVIGDTAVEDDEWFSVVLTDAIRARLGTPSQATVTILDDDRPVPDPEPPAGPGKGKGGGKGPKKG
jgi:hypothetical protein